MKDKLTLRTLNRDFPSSIVVFLVALPLCLGIALACGVAPFHGIISGIVGGILVGYLSGSQLSVSGPAAGLTIIVSGAIISTGSYEAFLLSVVIAGILQVIFGLLKAGVIGNFFPASVIKGMMAAIGITLILKQIPHAVGYDKDEEGDEEFFQHDGRNTFSELWDLRDNFTLGCIAIAVLSLFILWIWDKKYIKNTFFGKIPPPLMVVFAGIAAARLFVFFNWNAALEKEHMVDLPIAQNMNQFAGFFSMPNFSAWNTSEVWVSAVTLAIIASLETLLSIEATDKLDPQKRITPLNRELIAQGIGNSVSGLIGGLPLTSVVVRSTANVTSGAYSKLSSILHGVLLLIAVAFIPDLLNMIPKASLAVILIVTGYKLANIHVFKTMFQKGKDSFVPFIVTIVSILLSDLLIGIGIGVFIGLIYILRTNFRLALTITQDGTNYMVKFSRDVTFFNKSQLRNFLRTIPNRASLYIDMSRPVFVDDDIFEVIDEFKITAATKNIQLEIKKDPYHNNFNSKR
jgi:MFS superfamily sulfate permease-like transporter